MSLDASLLNGYVAVPAMLTFALGLVLGRRVVLTLFACLTALGTAVSITAVAFVHEFFTAVGFWR